MHRSWTEGSRRVERRCSILLLQYGDDARGIGSSPPKGGVDWAGRQSAVRRRPADLGRPLVVARPYSPWAKSQIKLPTLPIPGTRPCPLSQVVAKMSHIGYAAPMHVALVMNTAWGVMTLRSDLIRFLQSLRHHVSVVTPADATAIDLQRMGVTFEDWAVTRSGLNPFREGLAILRLRRLLARMQPDLILCFTPKAILLGSFAARATPSSHVFSVFTGLGFLFGSDNALTRALAPAIHFLFHQSLKNNPHRILPESGRSEAVRNASYRSS